MTIISFLNTLISQGKVAVVILVAACFVIGAKAYSDQSTNHEIVFSGPHQKTLPQIPDDPGFWSFTISDQNVISRSGQPSIVGFRWLKDNGWKSVVDLRLELDDTLIEGFKDLHFNYLALPIHDFFVPTDQQAQEFLDFVTDTRNQPVHIHCYAGVGRAGVMTALYRYMVQGWPMDKAISESRLFGGGPDKVQIDWLKKWAQAHKPGSYEKSLRL
jgi:atypical dual specificity phosphatase